MAALLLAKLGKDALRPQKVGGVWRKAAISAKNVARLKKEALLEGKEWEFDEPRKPESRRKPKGHKHDRLKPEREQAIQVKLSTADEAIAASRAAKRTVNASLIDRLLLTPKQLRIKTRAQ